MNWIVPHPEELAALRPDPLLWEQELDVRPHVAEALERETGLRAGRVFWRSGHDHLYSLELADLGSGRPSMARVFGHWDRWEPRPPEHEIDLDLLSFCIWVAQVADLGPDNVRKVAHHTGIHPAWPPGSVLRTPEERFAQLQDYTYQPRYAEIEGLKLAYIEAGQGDPVLMLHGASNWGYVYRHLIPPLVKAGRVIVPDLIGCGRSDKPAARNACTFRAHARWLRKFVEALDLRNIICIAQDWGGLLGLRALTQLPSRLAGIVAMDTTSLEGTDAGRAPFPGPEYQAAALTLPTLLPTHPDDPGAWEIRQAIATLRTLDLPVMRIAGKQPNAGPAEVMWRDVIGNARAVQEGTSAEIAGQVRAWRTRCAKA